MTIDGYCTLGVDREYDLTVDALLARMDQAGVDRAVIAAVDRFQAIDNSRGNELLLRAAAGYPDRLIPSCAATPWLGSEAVGVIETAAAAGARLLVMNPAVQGHLADDELVWPCLEAAAHLRLPVYVHTGPPGHATPWQLVGLARRFPELDLIMGHSGATDFWNDVAPAVRAADNLYVESSLARPFIVARHLEQVGYGKGIMGSAAPLGDLEFEWEQMRQAVPETARAAVCGGNLAALLSKRGPL